MLLQSESLRCLFTISVLVFAPIAHAQQPSQIAATTATLRVAVPDGGKVLVNGKALPLQPRVGGWCTFSLTGLVPNALYAKVAKVEIQFPDRRIRQPSKTLFVRAGETHTADFTTSYYTAQVKPVAADSGAADSGPAGAESDIGETDSTEHEILESATPESTADDTLHAPVESMRTPSPEQDVRDSTIEDSALAVDVVGNETFDPGDDPAPEAHRPFNEAHEELVSTTAPALNYFIMLMDTREELTARLIYAAPGLLLNQVQFDGKYLPDSVVLCDKTEWNVDQAFLKEQGTLELELLVKLNGKFESFPGADKREIENIALKPVAGQRIAPLQFKKKGEGAAAIPSLQVWIEESVQKNSTLYLSDDITHLGIQGKFHVGGKAVNLAPALEIRVLK